MPIPKLNLAKAVHRWDAPPASGFPIGSRVLVTRSDGSDTIGYIEEYDSAQLAYKVTLGARVSAEYKMCREAKLRVAPPPTAKEAAEEKAEEERVIKSRQEAAKLAMQEREQAVDKVRAERASFMIAGLRKEMLGLLGPEDAPMTMYDGAIVAALERGRLLMQDHKDHPERLADLPALLERAEAAVAAASQARQRAAAEAELQQLTAPSDLRNIDCAALKAAIEQALLLGVGVAAEAAKKTLGAAQRTQAQAAVIHEIKALLLPSGSALQVDRAALEAAIERGVALGLDASTLSQAHVRLKEVAAAHEKQARIAALEKQLSAMSLSDALLDKRAVRIAIARASVLGVEVPEAISAAAKAFGRRTPTKGAAAMAPASAHFAVGMNVLVKRSDGSESAATVVEFDLDNHIYTCKLGADGKMKRASEQDVRGQRYEIGAAVLVKRSDGSESAATVVEFELAKNIYTVKMADGKMKRTSDGDVRKDPNAPEENEEDVDIAAEEAGAKAAEAAALKAVETAETAARAETQQQVASRLAVAEAALNLQLERAATKASAPGPLGRKASLLHLDRAALRVALDEARAAGAVVSVAEATLAAADAAAKAQERADILAAELIRLYDKKAPHEIDLMALKAAIDRARASGGVATSVLAAASDKLADAQRAAERAELEGLLEELLDETDPWRVDRAALKRAIAAAVDLGVPIEAAQTFLLEVNKATAPAYRTYDRCAVSTWDVGAPLRRAYVISYDEDRFEYTLALGRPDSMEQQVVLAKEMKPFSALACAPEEDPQEFPLTSKVLVKRSSGQEQVGVVVAYQTDAKLGGMYKVELSVDKRSLFKMVPEMSLRLAELPIDPFVATGNAESALLLAEARPAAYAIGARVLVTRGGHSHGARLAFVEAHLPDLHAYKVSMFTPDSQEYLTAAEADLRPAPKARWPVGAHVQLIEGEQVGAVKSFDVAQNLYAIALLGAGDTDDCLLLPEDSLRDPKVTGFGVGARVLVQRSSGDTSLAFVHEVRDADGAVTVCLGKPGAVEKKTVAAGELLPAEPGHEDGAKVLVRRSNGDETVAFVESYDRAIGLYTLALYCVDSGEVKLACEADIRVADDAFDNFDLDASVYETPVQKAKSPVKKPSLGDLASSPEASVWHSTYISRDAAPEPSWYTATMKVPRK
ncbi:hypothetical protein Ctob_010718 [Chrysochromulina tobinii]|uniref:Uncharacterized protein n=1 Tax=Chrysochromulina tobinii TaxID=1460289 RepID=A0A0M0JMR3_9EUKA|nr:hypothetical protein Ctob_010718 [Chrysochromulina tobinii]|eukprot:KOO27884.1 hypothetical protein Ctob_010718 [Chrysochromulina sp. CCMP291]